MKYYKEDLEVIYIDESTTNVWQKPSKAWIPKDHPFKIKLANTRGTGVTIFGAISSKRRSLVYYLCGNSSIPNLKAFFIGLNNVINLRGKVIVLDNLSAH